MLFGAEVFVSSTDNPFYNHFPTISICMSGNKLLSATCLQGVRCDHFQKLSLKLFSIFADLLSHNYKFSLVLLISGSV